MHRPEKRSRVGKMGILYDTTTPAVIGKRENINSVDRDEVSYRLLFYAKMEPFQIRSHKEKRDED